MNINERNPTKPGVQPALYIIGIAVLALLAISHGIAAVKLLKDQEWVWMAIAFAAMGLYATVAEYLYNARRKATGAR